MIYGDYDVDGITATSILYRFFTALGQISDFIFPAGKAKDMV